MTRLLAPMSESVQLYSVREQLSLDAKQTIKNLKMIGINHAEGYDLEHLSELKPILSEYDIRVSSSFLLWSHITGRYDLAAQIAYPWLPTEPSLEQALDRAMELQLDTLVCGYLLPEERQTADDFYRVAEQLNKVGSLCQERGLRLLYHNHCFEFKRYGTHTGIDILIDNTDAYLVGFELDTLWCQMAGVEPEDYMRKLGARLYQLHLKSGKEFLGPLLDETEYPQSLHNVCLGQGVVKIDKVIQHLHLTSVDRVFIEHEYADDLLESIKLSTEYLRLLEQRSPSLT